MTHRRRIVRDSRGRFASVPGGSNQPAKAAPSSADAARRAALRRQRGRRVAKVGVIAVATVAVASQARPASRTRTAPATRRNQRTYVARAAADHRKLTSLRASAFPASRLNAPTFNARTARREAKTLTKGYRRQLRAARRVRR
jgi:hypothetical protein